MKTHNQYDLPRDLQQEIQVTVRKTTFRGKEQYQARYKKYKIVMERAPFGIIPMRDGDTWIVRPQKTPNGHIVFALPERCVRDRNGNDPLMEVLRSFIGGRFHFHKGYGRDLTRREITAIEDIHIAGNTLTIVGPVRAMKRSDVFFHDSGEKQLTFSLPEIHWKFEHGGTISGRVHSGTFFLHRK